jgi:uncharacterized protein (TIGR00369 family)
MQYEPGPGSPFVQLIGATSARAGEGPARLALTLEEKHMNPNGVVHGGVLTSLMDEACGAAIVAVRGMEAMIAAPHATVDMNVSFMSGARVGDRLAVEAKALRVGRSVAFAEAEVIRNGDTLMAKGRFTFLIQERRNA